MSDVDPHADTAYRGPERRGATTDDCAAGVRALALLVGDPYKPENPSVFARLGSIERKIGLVGAMVVLPLWVMAGLAMLDRWAQ